MKCFIRKYIYENLSHVSLNVARDLIFPILQNFSKEYIQFNIGFSLLLSFDAATGTSHTIQ